MSFEVRFASSARKDFLALDRPVQARVLARLREARKAPTRHAARLKGRPEWKLRVGDHRILVAIREDDRILEVLHIGHRRNVYD